MAGYCTITDMVVHGTPANKPYSATTKPSIIEINTTIIPYIYREINARLSSAGVTVPAVSADSPEAYALCADINALGAAAKALRIAFPKRGNERDWIDDLKADYERRLKTIGEDTASLIDASGMNTDEGVPWAETNDLWEAADSADIAEVNIIDEDN